jgi:hypothetical protein
MEMGEDKWEATVSVEDSLRGGEERKRGGRGEPTCMCVFLFVRA